MNYNSQRVLPLDVSNYLNESTLTDGKKIRLPSDGKLNPMAIMQTLDPSRRTTSEDEQVYGTLVFPEIVTNSTNQRGNSSLLHHTENLQGPNMDSIG